MANVPLTLSEIARTGTGDSNRLVEAVAAHAQYQWVEGFTAATLKFYKTELGAFVRWMEVAGKVETAVVTGFDIMTHLAELKDRVSPASVKTRFTAIRAFFSWAKDWDLIETNPAAKLKPPRVPKVRKEFMTEAQFDSLLALCPMNTLLGARRQAMLQLFVTAGIRRRELSLLTLADLNWSGSSVRVIYGKGQKERNVPFVRVAQRVMLRYLRQREDQLGDVWVTEAGKPLGYWGIGQDMEKLLERAGVTIKDCCHWSRRTFAANAVRQKMPRPWVQGVMGHSTPTMTDAYVASMVGEQEAIEAFKDFSPWG